jgi:hypothetical protein
MMLTAWGCAAVFGPTLVAGIRQATGHYQGAMRWLALATLVSAVDKPLIELSGAVANPLNIALDFQTASDLKAVWPDVKTFLGTLGVKF